MRIGQYENEELFYLACEAMARDQRESDLRKSTKGRPHVMYRGKSDMCLAYSTVDHHFYIGYSAVAGGIVGNHDYYNNKFDPDQPGRRFDRIRRIVGVTDPLDRGRENRPIVNCAEACALSIAVSWDQKVQNLVFVTFYPSEGDHRRLTSTGGPLPKDPCGNCLSWLVIARGYFYDSQICLRQD